MSIDRIVWKFGDGHTAYTPIDPARALPEETREEQITRMVNKYERTLMVPSVRPDGTMRNPQEQAAYVAQLGAGAHAQFAGIISEEEYMDKFLNYRDVREAWTWTTNDPVIELDIEKARARKVGDLRRLRAPVLEQLDVAYQRADEASNTVAKGDIAAAKADLRNITLDEGLAKAATIEDLRTEAKRCESIIEQAAP